MSPGGNREDGDDDFAAEMHDALRRAPGSGGISLTDPGEGTITKRDAQKLFVDGMAIVMEEWFGRGRTEGTLLERQRIGAILRDRATVGRLDLALTLALTSDAPVDQVLAELNEAPRAIELQK